MSLNGPLGSNYQYGCCDQEVSVMAILNSETQPPTGCETQVHEVSTTFDLEQAKDKKIIDRIIAHQLIILETTGNKYIEDIKIREFNPNMDEKQSTIKLSEGNSQPSSLVRPSSLNYKISLREAVNDFIKKETPLNDDQILDVQTEDPRVSASQNGNVKNDFEEFDDHMFDMTPSTRDQRIAAANVKVKSTHPTTPNTLVRTDAGQDKDAWFREEEIMRKKLEKTAIAQLKSRIAQANRAAGSKQTEPVKNDNDQDSDMDINNNEPDIPVGSGGGAINANAVQLTAGQIEEAKQMTYGKMKQYRRDRLYTSDRERLSFLTD